MQEPFGLRHSSENLRTSYSSFQENFNKYPKRNSNEEKTGYLGGIIESPQLFNEYKRNNLSSPDVQYTSQKSQIIASSSFDSNENR